MLSQAYKLRSCLHKSSSVVRQQVRNLSIHEYRSAELLRQYGVGTPKGAAAHTVDEATKIAKELGGKNLVVKAQASFDRW